MASLSSRLARLKELGLARASELPMEIPKTEAAPDAPAPEAAALTDNERPKPAFLRGWERMAPHLWTRTLEMPVSMPASVNPDAWAGRFSGGEYLRPGFPRDPAAYSFFDFETTGLSGGAGTIPFLVAVGGFAAGEPVTDRGPGARAGRIAPFLVTQYFLDDYPGEPDFLAALLGLLESRNAMATYNGKAFDAPLLRTRCIMNGIAHRDIPHVDALHAARRLWRGRTPSCSLKALEFSVLGHDRGDDVPGELIPRVWLDFLATGNEGAMDLVCSHNAHDVSSLARLFFLADRIYADPGSEARRAGPGADDARLALWLWRTARAGEALSILEESVAEDQRGAEEAGILRFRILRRSGRRDEAIRAALALPDSPRCCVIKAKVCEHALRDFARALDWTDRALALCDTASSAAVEPPSAAGLARRKARLLERMESTASQERSENSEHSARAMGTDRATGT